MKRVEEKTFRFYEVSFYILSICILALLSIVIYFVGQKPKICIDGYDVNGDNQVDIYDILEETNKINNMKEFIINEN